MDDAAPDVAALATAEKRRAQEDELDASIEAWTRGQDRWELAATLQAHGIAAAQRGRVTPEPGEQHAGAKQHRAADQGPGVQAGDQHDTAEDARQAQKGQPGPGADVEL